MNETNLTLEHIIEAALLAAAEPLDIINLLRLFPEDAQPEKKEILTAIENIQLHYQQRGIELVELASGYCIRVKASMSPWLARLWEQKPARYSRALLETLALIAYKQPITRGEIEKVRGVAVSSHIVRTLLERNWVRIVGHRDLPGKPSLYATTKEFLDNFSLKSLNELPPLAEIKDLDEAAARLGMDEVIAEEIKEDQQGEIKQISLEIAEEVEEEVA